MKITKEQLKYILGDDWGFFEEKILTNYFCGNCRDERTTTIVNWQASLDGLNDIILKGRCAKCGGSVCRVSETGENEEYTERIEEVKKQLKKVRV